MLSLATKQTAVNVKMMAREPNFCLVADFENSIPPSLWHLDLEKIGTFTVSLRGSGDDWALGMTAYKSEFVAIARFDDREDAEDALAAVQKALMNRPIIRTNTCWKWILSILVVLALLFVGLNLSTGTSGHQAKKASPAVVEKEKTPPIDQQLGVPLPADDMLRRQ